MTFRNKTLLITGGTGSFGNAVLNRFLSTEIKEIRVFSRDEKKQFDMLLEYRMKEPKFAGKIKFVLGDIRDTDSVLSAMQGVDYVFHAAALKQVPSCELYPMEAVKTNVIGTDNVLNAAISAGVSSVICLSTDKAVYPVSTMGITKALAEKIMIEKARGVSDKKTVICCVRCGNILFSRGSVVPLWIKQIKNNQNITLTEPSMTRFVITVDEAVDLVLYAFENGTNGDIFIKKSPACTIKTLAEAVCELCGRNKDIIEVSGIRNGEKLFETLLTNEELSKTVDLGNYYKVCNSPEVSSCCKVSADFENEIFDGINSNNTRLLNAEEVKKKLLECKDRVFFD